MNTAVLPSFGPRSPSDAPGVYVSLDELMRLRARTTGISFLPRQPVHSILSGRRASRLRGRGLNFEEIRHYQTGDDIRTMDWRVTARTREPHVRVYTEERDRPVLLLVDQRQTMFFGSRRAMKSVVAAEAAALAAWSALGHGDRVGAIVFDDRESVEIVPRRSDSQVQHALAAIVAKNRALSSKTPRDANAGIFDAVLERAARLAVHDFLVCIISDAHGADAQSVRHVTSIAAHNDVLSIFIYDPLESALPNAGRLTVAGREGQLEVDTASAGLRERYRSVFAEQTSQVRELSRARQIPVLTLCTAEDVVTQVRRQLGQRLDARSRR
jgi:uncharacterized protein (DUF58 family)